MTVLTWERWTNGPLLIAATAFLAAYAVPILRTDLPGTLVSACQMVVWLTWGLFATDYLARLLLSEDRRQYALQHWFDVVIIALPLFRPLRLLRLLPLLRVLNRRASNGLRGRIALYVVAGTGLLGFCGALAVLDAERANPEANIRNFGDAAWWAITTMTTVGYGDRYPTTGVGRVAAVALMLGGIALLGAVTAMLASWLVEQVQVSEERQTEELKADIEELQTDLGALNSAVVVATLQGLRAALDGLETRLQQRGVLERPTVGAEELEHREEDHLPQRADRVTPSGSRR